MKNAHINVIRATIFTSDKNVKKKSNLFFYLS